MITVYIDSDLQVIKDSLHDALTAMCLDGKVIYDLDGNTVIFAKDASLTAAKADVVPSPDQVAALDPINLPADLPSVVPPARLEPETDSFEIPLAPPVEPVVDLPTVDPLLVPDGGSVSPTDQVPALAPALEPAVKVTGNVTLRNLSMVNQIPYEVDDSAECSTLCVPSLTKRDGGINFSYCDSSYGHPLADPSAGEISNQNPQYTDTTIRVIAVFPSAGGEQCIPILLKLIDGDACRVVFGRDVAIPRP